MSLYKKNKDKKNASKIAGVFFIFITILIIFLVINQNQNQMYSVKTESSIPVRIIASVDFGEVILFNKNIEIQSGESSLDVLFKIANITTSYGGGYVQSINGIESQYNSKNNSNKDWFYYVNGILASVGASVYKPHLGDVIHWDFHKWSEDRSVTAIIGSYPEPFVHGYNGKSVPTSIIFNEDFYESAVSLQKYLENLGVVVSIYSFNDLSYYMKQNHNLILIDTYDNNLISSLNEDFNKIGWFIKYDNDQIKTFTQTGKNDIVFDEGGVVISTQNIWNPKGNWHCENVIWIVSGITDSDVISAANLLFSDNFQFLNYASLVIKDNKIYKVP